MFLIFKIKIEKSPPPRQRYTRTVPKQEGPTTEITETFHNFDQLRSSRVNAGRACPAIPGSLYARAIKNAETPSPP